MYNTDLPNRAELPSSRQLLRSTAIALVAAGALLITTVLPAEYGIDPTGMGRALGLTQPRQHVFDTPHETWHELAAGLAQDLECGELAFLLLPRVQLASAMKQLMIEIVQGQGQAVFELFGQDVQHLLQGRAHARWQGGASQGDKRSGGGRSGGRRHGQAVSFIPAQLA